MTGLPLYGLTIIEFGQGVAAPFAGKMFADLGARVIKVEPPKTGDEARTLAPLKPGVPPPESSGMFAYLNSNKKSVTLDLSTEKGGNLAADLCRKADVVIENFKPGTLEKLGLGFERLHSLNPTTVLASITWFGQQGPYRDFKGNDPMIYALSGLSYYLGPREGPPTLLGGYQSQFVGGLTAFMATLGVVVGRFNGFNGQHIDVSILEANLCFTETGAASFANSGIPGVRLGINRFIPTYPACAFPCKDGWIGVTALTPAQWRALCDLLDRPEWGESPDYFTSLQRLEQADVLDPLLTERLLERTADEWFHEAQARRIPFALVPTMAELLGNSHFKKREAFVSIHHPDLGSFKAPAVPFKLLKTPALAGGVAPRLGMHNREVLGGILGLTENELGLLQREEVI
jgi:crotonobetainyl-CoA:carnitine CoA-transferase CaiB-like acyl-CoA transferase